MTPGSFDPATAREVVGDVAAREIEGRARRDADAAEFNPPPIGACATYWGKAQEEMRAIIYREQHRKRIARNERKRQTSTQADKSKTDAVTASEVKISGKTTGLQALTAVEFAEFFADNRDMLCEIVDIIMGRK